MPTENAAGVHRIVYTGSNAAPTARIAADPTSGAAPLTVSFDGTTSTDPDGDALTYAWDLDGNGTLRRRTGAKPSRTYAAGTYIVGLRVDDGHGHTSTATAQIQAGNTAPVLGTVTPDPSLDLGGRPDRSASRATATDPQQGTLPASAFCWNLAIRHCPSACATPTTSAPSPGPSGSFPAPDHEYPSHLLLTVTVTDSGGLTDSGPIAARPEDRRPGLRQLADRRHRHGQRRRPRDAVHRDVHPGLPVTITAAPTTAPARRGAPSATGRTAAPLPRAHRAVDRDDVHRDVHACQPNTAPTVTRVTAYPAGGFYVGQTLGFDAAATDPQQALPDSAYSFAMERQDCDSGCPRVLVRTWTGVGSGQFVVPELPYPSHLYLVATATDAHGATGRGELRIDPRPVALTVKATRKLRVDVDGEDRTGTAGPDGR